jgi:hypothetical protein
MLPDVFQVALRGKRARPVKPVVKISAGGAIDFKQSGVEHSAPNK